MTATEPKALLSQPLEPLSADQVMKLAKRFMRAAGRVELGRPLKVALLAGFLTDYLADTLVLMLARRGFAVELWRAPYGVMAGAVLEEDGALAAFAPDLAILLPTHRDLARVPAPGATIAAAQAAAEAEAQMWHRLWRRLGCPVVQLSFDPPPARPLGELEGFVPGGVLDHARRVNRALADDLLATVTLVDAEWLAARVGLERWHDSRLYAMCKQPFSFDVVPMVAEALAGAAAGLLARGRKCLVLDLDNTLWGGEIGDLGVEGITLGSETAEGEAFVAMQRYAKALGERGVVLAVCSKNNDAIARTPFQQHSAMALKLDDIACFMANFEDKAGNIRAIAQKLNLGLDALVFVDDNPVERAWVRERLPEVLVVELPDDPALYVRALDDCGAFPLARLTAEDLGRAASYQARAQVAERLEAGDDMDSFLASLEARAFIEPVGPAALDRIVQIIGKTNQFKLNPTTFTAEDITARGADVLAIRFADRLQDYGIVAVAVTRPEDGALRIDNWVMSCRVFSRRLEHATRILLGRMAAQRGLTRLTLRYEPSAKNGLLAGILPKLGFETGCCGGEWAAPAAPPADLAPHHIFLAEDLP